MFGLFKKKEKVKQPPQLLDLDGEPLMENDLVEALRYDLGTCRLILEGLHYYYESQAGDQRVSYVKMIDAATEQQKVRKIKS